MKKTSIKKQVLMIIVLSFVLLMSFGCSLFKSEPKEFSKDGLKITLTDDFIESPHVNYNLFLNSGKCIFGMVTDVDTSLAMNSPKTYLEILISNMPEIYEKEDVLVYSDDNLTFSYIYYANTVGERDYFYMTVVLESPEKFFGIDFCCPKSEKETYKQQFLDWAKTIVLE